MLTASHCIMGKFVGDMEILVGTNDLTKGGQYYKVEKLIPHEHYNNPEFAYDIAVVQLKDKIKYGPKVKAIELGTGEVPDGAKVTLTGWGRLSVSLTRFYYYRHISS